MGARRRAGGCDLTRPESEDDMKPIGPLMIEHRLIERMVALLEGHLREVESGASPNAELLDAAVDFFRTYADRTHHGKEEDLLFEALGGKSLRAERQAEMDELVEEHKTARGLVKAMLDARQRFASGDKQARQDLTETLGELTSLYPGHIEKEDKSFFPAAMEVLSDEEQQDMLGQFAEFDRQMIHEKYRGVVDRFEG